MKMKDVIISITGTQVNPYGDDEKIDLITDGEYLFENGQGSFTYLESELTGLVGTRTTFTTDNINIVMLREGSLNSRMVFETGKMHHFFYDTPYGATTMGINTSKISCQMGEHGGNMEIDYVVDYDHSIVGRSSFKINVREQGKGGGAKCQI